MGFRNPIRSVVVTSGTVAVAGTVATTSTTPTPTPTTSTAAADDTMIMGETGT